LGHEGAGMSRLYKEESIEHMGNHLPLPETIDNPHYYEYLKLAQKEWHFSDLLMMHKEQTILTNNQQKIKVLNLLMHLYRSASEALHAFYIDRKLELFDAHVGESACQIRAVRLAVMLKEINIKTSTQAFCKSQVYKQEADKVEELLRQYQIPHNQIEGSINLKIFLAKYKLDYHIDNNFLFIHLSYVLYKYKLRLTIDRQVLDYSSFACDWCFSQRKSEKILLHFQKINSFLSVRFLVGMNFFCGNESYIFHLLRRDMLGRWVLPSSVTIQCMLDLIEIYNLPVRFQVLIEDGANEFKEYVNLKCEAGKFYVEDQNQHYHELKLKQPIINLESYVKNSKLTQTKQLLCQRLSSLGLSYILKANAASHPAYLCKSLGYLNDNPFLPLYGYFSKTWVDARLRELRHLQASSLADGLCKSRADTLAVSHISCKT